MRSQALESIYLKISSYKDGNTVLTRDLNQSQLLVGRAPNCDIVIEDPSISYYHAIINLAGPDSGKIVDLDSVNGTFINGERKNEVFFSLGDVLRFGTIDFYVEETHIEKEIEDVEGQTTVIKSEELEEHIVEKKPIEGLTLIDGEYCDITFDDEQYQAADLTPVYDNKYDYSEFIDTEEAPENDLGIEKESTSHSVEVTILSRGNILSTTYLPLKNKSYTIGDSKKRNNIRLETYEDQVFPFIDIKNGEITLHQLSDFKVHNLNNIQDEPFSSSSNFQLNNDDILYYTFGTVQVLVKMIPSPPSLKFAPFFGRDRNFQMHLLKVSSIMMACILSLLLVDVSDLKEDEEEKPAVIYKKVVKAPVPSKEPTSEKTSKDKPPGQKEQKQPDKQLAKAKEGKPKPKKEKVKKVPQKKKLKKLATVKQPPKKKPKTPPKPKIKAYSFNLDKSLKSIVGQNKSPTKVNVNKADTKVSVNTGLTNSLNKSSKLKTQTSNKIGSLGSDKSGFKNKSYGAYGLSSKKGVDTAYVEPETVVLGSMDPEVLRKILQEYLPQFKHCYQQELQINESVKGIIDLQFTIGKSGRVTKAKVKTKRSKFSKRGMNCMKKVLGVIQFPKPKGGGQVDVRQPLNFFSENQKI